ncbi:hypothetical protein [Bacillus sp. Brlt_9]|uniref:hypothetical protein n=1 Tax=Bacillus sp. Brlt_9 TaxID=3110916 RepID=UPI003F7B5AE2
MNRKWVNLKIPNEIVHLDNLWNIWQRKVPYLNQKDLGWTIWSFADRNNISLTRENYAELVIMFLEENSYELKIGLESLLRKDQQELKNMVRDVDKIGIGIHLHMVNWEIVFDIKPMIFNLDEESAQGEVSRILEMMPEELLLQIELQEFFIPSDMSNVQRMIWYKEAWCKCVKVKYRSAFQEVIEFILEDSRKKLNELKKEFNVRI